MSDSTGGFTPPPPPPPPPSAGGGGPIPQRGIGAILSTAFEVYKANAAKLITVVAILIVPLTLLNAVLSKVVFAPRKETVQTIVGPVEILARRSWLVALAAGTVGVALAIVMSFVVQAAVSRAAAQATVGDPVDSEGSYRWGLAHLGSVLLIALLTGLAVFVGLLLLIVPGIIVAVMLSVTIPALVFEGKRGTEALSRSWNLVKGSFWHVLGTILLAALIAGIVTGILTGVGGDNWLVYWILGSIGAIVTVPFTALVSVLLYLDLRGRQESLTGDTLRSELSSGT